LISKNKETNTIGIKYDLTAFENKTILPWHALSLEYTHHTKNLTAIARINYANKFNMSGLQFEGDLYPAISKKIYAYISAGYSDYNGVFPKYRAGFSLYTSLPSAMEAEGGIRLLHFTWTTWIYTASVSKYFKNYWFNVSTFLTPASGRLIQSYFLKTRYYLNDKDFIMLTIGTGISPDDRNNNIQLNTNASLRSKKAEISFRNTFKKKNVILISAGWMNQEYEFKKFSSQYSFGIGFERML
jgi:YaiO family outer membrane protein